MPRHILRRNFAYIFTTAIYNETEKDVTVINSDIVANRSHNRNIGAERAKHELLLFVDGDIVLLDNCLTLIKLALTSGYEGELSCL